MLKPARGSGAGRQIKLSSARAEQRRWSRPPTATCTGSDGTEGSSTHRWRYLKRPRCDTREQAVAQIRDTVLGHPWFRAVCVGDGDGRPVPVGQVSVWPYADEGGRRANIGYALAHDQWGRGIAAAAIRMVVGRVFDDLPGLERLEAVTDVENVRSQRVLEKAGFHREGVLRRYIAGRGGGEARDAVIYSFLSSDRA